MFLRAEKAKQEAEKKAYEEREKNRDLGLSLEPDEDDGEVWPRPKPMSRPEVPRESPYNPENIEPMRPISEYVRIVLTKAASWAAE